VSIERPNRGTGTAEAEERLDPKNWRRIFIKRAITQCQLGSAKSPPNIVEKMRREEKYGMKSSTEVQISPKIGINVVEHDVDPRRAP
jgi:hypothetical protein